MKTIILAFLVGFSPSLFAEGTTCESVKTALGIIATPPYVSAGQLILEDTETLERVEIHIAEIADFVMDIPHALDITQYAITEIDSYEDGPLLTAIDKMATLSIFKFLEDPQEQSCLIGFNFRKKTSRNSIFKRIKVVNEKTVTIYSTIESEMDQEIVIRRAS